MAMVEAIVKVVEQGKLVAAVIAIFKYQIKPGRLPDFMGKLAAAADPKLSSSSPRWASCRAAALACLHQHHREHDGHRASRHPQREALEFALNGIAMDRCGHARSQEGLSQAKSLQATSGPTSRACCSLRKGNKETNSHAVAQNAKAA
jgi:hypothetical protein